MNKLTLDVLKDIFPRKPGTIGVTGYIPMGFAEMFIDDIAEIVKTHKLRRFYRGPRKQRFFSSTAKADAKYVVLYRKHSGGIR